MNSILDLNLAEVEQLLTDMGQPPYRARQILSWIYGKHVLQWERMSNLPLTLRESLASQWAIMTSRTEEVQKSSDGTVKILIRLHDAHAVESVFIPEGDRSSVCLSTQVGCPVGCSFCASGKGGLKRNLTSGEILEQILHLFSVLPAEAAIRNVVLMGIGEPMRNYDNVMRAIRTMNAPWGFEIGARRITISTIGDLKGIERFSGEGLQVNLAISLHGPDDRTRAKILPARKVPPVAKLVEAAKSYFARTRRRVSFEYVLVEGINSSLPHARSLAQLLGGFPCFVNLIRLNPVEGVPLKSPDEWRVRAFLQELERLGIPAAIRARRGSDVSAACGQLAGESRPPQNVPPSPVR
jgi:23S rRNA (adenine2503-C2)-methyltransferase